MGININRILQETSRVQPHLVAGYHGEDIRLEVSYRNYGQPVSLDGADITFYWRTSIDEPGHWHEAAGSVENGMAVAVWGPTMDAGPDDVQWFIRTDLDDSTTYRAAGAFRLLASPGFVPAILPPAMVTLDFATIQVLNAPYYTKGETDTEISQAIAAIPAPPVQSVNGKTGVVVLGAADVGAMPSSANGSTILISAGGNTIKAITDALATAVAGKLDKSGGTIANDLEIRGDTSIGGYLVVSGAVVSENVPLATQAWVSDQITQGTAIYRGSFATKAALNAVQWQTSNPDAPNFVSNNDYAVVLADESQDGGCWRYLYVIDGQTSGWEEQYEINESPMTQAQLDALNSGATAAKINSIADKLDKTTGGTIAGNVALYEPDNGASLYFPSQGKGRLYFGSGLLDANDQTGTVTVNGQLVAVASDLAGLASTTYVDTAIANAVGTINNALDNINGEVI